MKKKLLYYILISLFPICLFLILLGTFIKNSVLTYIGVWALFGGFFLLAVLSVILIFMRARKKADEMDAQEQKGEEYSPAPSDHRYDALADVIQPIFSRYYQPGEMPQSDGAMGGSDEDDEVHL